MLLRKWVLLILITFVLISCSDDSDNPAGSHQILRINPTIRSVANSDDSTFFDIIASSEWTVSESSDWISAHPSSGEGNGRITVQYISHAGDSRSCDITVNAPGHVPETVTSKLIQSANPALKIIPPSISIDDRANTVYFNVTASGEWEALEALDWLSVNPVIGDGSGQVAVVVLKNEGNARTGVVTITAPNHFPTASTISITQSAKPLELRIVPRSRVVSYDSEVSAFSVYAGGQWSVGTTADWIRIDPRQGSGDGYFRVLYSENLNTERSAEINVQAPGHRPEEVTVHFSQESSPIASPLAPRNFRVSEVYWDEVFLEWSDVSDNEEGFIIERKDGQNGIWGELNRVGSGMSEYRDISLFHQSDYQYRIFGYNTFGRSESSNGIAVRTHSPPQDILVNGLAEGVIDPAADKDWYICEISELRAYTVSVTLVDLGSASLWIYGPTDRSRLRLSDLNSGGENPQITDSFPSGTYFIKVGPKENDSTGSYSIEVR